jgi:hypothetical protein
VPPPCVTCHKAPASVTETHVLVSTPLWDGRKKDAPFSRVGYCLFLRDLGRPDSFDRGRRPGHNNVRSVFFYYDCFVTRTWSLMNLAAAVAAGTLLHWQRHYRSVGHRPLMVRMV